MKWYMIILVALFLGSCAMYPSGKELIEQGKLVQEDMPVVNTVDEAYRWVYYNVTYIEEEAGKDYWQSPIETLVKRTGDCEDFCILFMWLIATYQSDSSSNMLIYKVVELNTGHAVAEYKGIVYDFNHIIEKYTCNFMYSMDYAFVMSKVKD